MASGAQVAIYRRRFLEALAESCNVRASAQAAGVPVHRLYAWRARNQGFARAWSEALRTGYEQLEERLLRHALSCLDPATGEGAGEAARERMTNPELQLAMFLLNRYRAAVTPDAAAPTGRRKAVADDTEQRLHSRIDAVMRRRGEAT